VACIDLWDMVARILVAAALLLSDHPLVVPQRTPRKTLETVKAVWYFYKPDAVTDVHPTVSKRSTDSP